jgi:hypothetical protein
MGSLLQDSDMNRITLANPDWTVNRKTQSRIDVSVAFMPDIQ